MVEPSCGERISSIKLVIIAMPFVLGEVFSLPILVEKLGKAYMDVPKFLLRQGSMARIPVLNGYFRIPSSRNLKINTVDSRLTEIGLSGTTRKKKESADCGRWNVREDHILLNPSYCFGLVQPTLSPARLQLDSSENVDEEAVEQWINEDSTSESCKVLSDDDIVSRVSCGSEETRNFEECPESDEENLVTHQKLSHGDALVHTEALLNYLEQEDDIVEKMILRNLRSIIR
ncbi:hypothetical protein AVEN_88009-1 [Araneus ventricosus]|uniref:Uncharacterized protein n=1 Tax=Araneus ventricosus TaxID=182803 RepID=A0A4Y2G0W0_ARAVE|nr:hypothetical protein AVEN_88009-1 [Araneus ventricosus]